MKTILSDKVSSVTLNCNLSREVRIGEEIPSVEGGVIAVSVLTSKSTYDKLELVSGRMSTVKRGDILIGALGHRKALFGYSGVVPEVIHQGDRLQLLNLGGVLGICDSINPDLGEPFQCEVLGQVLHFPFLGERVGIPAHIQQNAIPLSDKLDTLGIPVVAVVGTSMNSGKTAAACALIQALTHKGLRVVAAKATGVSLRRDILAMGDSGAIKTLIFTDLGIVTTTRKTAPIAARTLLTQLAYQKTDIIVLELGDGLLGLYGVDAILNDLGIQKVIKAVILAANDPVAAWGGAYLLKERHGLCTTVITGPATDNSAGIRLVEDQTGVPGINSRTHPNELADKLVCCL